MSEQTTVMTCVHCGQQVYWETDRLVEVRSGDDGGTYGWCDTGPENKHHA